MPSKNLVILIGHLGRDPETKYLPNGTAVCNFNLATSEQWIGKDGAKEERTEWHRVVAWGKLAEICNQYLQKGTLTYVEGKLQTRIWTDKEGNKRYTTEIGAQAVLALNKRREIEEEVFPLPQSGQNDDIPF